MMKKHFNNLRKFIEKNKIFFELIPMVSLSIMAIIVSKNSNEISQNQTLIMSRENEPNIDIIFYQTLDDSTTIPTSVWNIYNRGGRLTEYDLKDISFVRSTMNVEGEFVEKLIPLYFYLDPYHEISGETNGLVQKLKNNICKSKYLELNKSFLGNGYMELETYIEISYTDFLNERKNKYYSLSPMKEINKAKWDSLLSYYQSRKKNQLNDLTFNKIKLYKQNKKVI
jgi:hypothetical protein